MDTKTHYTEIEVEEGLAQLSDSDISRLLQIFSTQGTSARTGLSEKDILNNAIRQVLENERPWPIGVDVVTFLKNSGRSYISNEANKRKRQVAMPVDELTIYTDENLKICDVISKTHHISLENEIDKNHSSNLISPLCQHTCRLKNLVLGDKNGIYPGI